MGSRVSGKTAFVTGAANGIGRSIAERLGEEGASIVIADVDVEAADETAAAFADEGIEAEAIECDVSDRESVREAVDATLDAFGSLDVLVNNAGISVGERFEDITPEEWQQVMDVNLTGIYNCSAEAVPAMAEQGDGRILNISSIAGLNLSYAGPASYTASKWGVIGLTKHMAWDLSDYGIRVNALCPGGTLTPLIEQLTSEEEREATRSKIPLDRMAKPRDHADAALFLVSDEASYVTGTTLTVDGGLSLSVRQEV
ncbi:SDR family NAD(P)-dependent oxidoreductase [Halorussus halobius]|uniref:SDR family NAD(P)-dependent oxidoreductase n=1 Tax=Halorussus halobius TaxID=1710537 RepID=UPI0010918EDF|nr:SDR family NAD(P)-dependent oxidoreductase [Halorussus halobius]